MKKKKETVRYRLFSIRSVQPRANGTTINWVAVTRMRLTISSPSKQRSIIMDPAYTMQDQQPFSYFHIESAAQYRQPVHFTSHPSEMQPYYGHIQHFPQQQQQQHCMPEPQPIYSSQPFMHPMTNTDAYHPDMNNMTPMSSPQPSHLKPTIIVQDSPMLMPLDTRFVSTDFYGFSSSPPPLSTPGSTISSPPCTSDALRTPVNEGFFSFEKVEGVKEGCESEVHSEILASADWSRSNTPPMTPGE